MKYIRMFMAALLLGGLATSCMDDDWEAPSGATAPYGDNSITEDANKLISIKELKEKTIDKIPASVANDTIRITEDWQIKARVTGNDIEGNIYNQVSLEDENGDAIVVCIQKGGLFSILPLGQEILVNLKDLYIGIYGNMPQIGIPYSNTSGKTFPSRMPFSTWNNHFKILGVADASKVKPEVFDIDKIKDEAYVKSHRGKLMTIKGVELAVNNATTKWAPEEDKDAGGSVNRDVKINGKVIKSGSNSIMVVRSSTYADFAADYVPTCKVDITGIFSVYSTNPSKYGYTWQIALRTGEDISIVTGENN